MIKMKNCIKYEIIFFVIFLIIPVTVNAQRGCCSYHGGVAGCSEMVEQFVEMVR